MFAQHDASAAQRGRRCCQADRLAQCVWIRFRSFRPQPLNRAHGLPSAASVDEQAGKLRIAKLNVDDNPSAARRFDVMSIPTLIVFKDGQPAKRLGGAKPKGALLEELSEFL